MGSSGKKGKAVKFAFRSSCINYNSSSVRRPGIESSDQGLDCFYRTMLSANPDHKQLHLILSAILVLPGHLEPTPAHIELLLGLPKGDLVSRLPRVFQMLNIGGWEDAISLHISFGDFLLDEKRAGSFHVDIQAQKQIIAQKWLEACQPQGYGLAGTRSITLSCIHAHTSISPHLHAQP